MKRIYFIFFLLDIRAILHKMDLNINDLEMLRREFLVPLYWYGAGLLLALLFVFLLKSAGKAQAV